jgi:hypothetical protein
MTSTESTFVRLLVSLEEFAAQESVQLAAGNIVAVREIQERAAPIVDGLVRLGRDAIPAEVHARLVALVNRRLQNQETLDRRVGQMRDALGQTQANLRRIGQIAPVYGRQAKSAATRAVA